MSVEIEFPIDFVVEGVPVSIQAKKRAKRKEAWISRIRAAAVAKLPQNHFAAEHPVEVTIFFFSDTEIGRDLDNVIKPILDALSGCVYIDDRQVEKLVIQRFERSRPIILKDPSETLAEAGEMEGPRVYIKVGEAGA